MIRYKFYSVLIALCTFSVCDAQNPMKLWYNKPAENWNEALPIGNGRLGAMVFGQPEKETIQLNEETVWAGEPGNNVLPGVYDSIQAIRKLLFEGNYQAAQNLSNKVFPRQAASNNNYGMQYQPVGNLAINFPSHKSVTGYYRDLDISNAIETIKYSVGGVDYQREIFAPVEDQVIVMRLTANKPQSISCVLSFNTPHKKASVRCNSENLVLEGKTSDVDNKIGRIQFDALAKPVLEGGTASNVDSAVEIKNANAVTIYISMATNYKSYKDISINAFAKASGFLTKALKKDYATIKAAHIKNYQAFFNRVSLGLGITDAALKPTNERIIDFAKGNDPQLVALYFQFGRYLLISCSQPGNQPANLQGIWNDKLSPPWDSKYTVNINTEMNYWPAEVTNLPEMHQPLFSMIKDLAVTGQESAKEMYHARGWNMHHNTDLWRITGPVDGGFYGMWPMGGAWLSQHLWQHFLFTGDTAFLKEVYPILKGAALFYVDALQTEPTHNWLVVAPSMSPENNYMPNVGLSAGTTMDNQLVFDVFSNIVSANALLKNDGVFTDTIKKMIDRLPPMQIGQYGQLQEWLQDWDAQKSTHRHVSHLYGLFPSNQISVSATPELYEAAKTTLISRGDKSTGWSMGWKVNWWARLHDGNHAFKLISDQLNPAPTEQKGQDGGTYPNLFDAHPPFQIDGNFGCTSGIAEMLLQSQDGVVEILPALPDAWQQGKVTGLIARGAFVVDMQWDKNKITRLTIQSKIGGVCRLRVSDELKLLASNTMLKKAVGQNPNFYYRQSTIKKPLVSSKADMKVSTKAIKYEYDLKTEAGKVYELIAK